MNKSHRQPSEKPSDQLSPSANSHAPAGSKAAKPANRNPKAGKAALRDKSSTPVLQAGGKGKKPSPKKGARGKRAMSLAATTPKSTEAKAECSSYSTNDCVRSDDAMHGYLEGRLDSVIAKTTSAWSAMKTRLAVRSDMDTPLARDRKVRAQVSEVATNFAWMWKLSPRVVQLAALSFPRKLEELIDPTGDSTAQINDFMGWAACIHRLAGGLPEYGRRFAKLHAPESISSCGDPKLDAIQMVLEAELHVAESRMHEKLGGRTYFDKTIEEEAREAMPVLAAAKAALIEGQTA